MVIYDLSSKRVLGQFTAHENRIKDMTWVNLKTIGSEMIDQETVDENDRWLVTTSSDGFIKIWSFDFSNVFIAWHLLIFLSFTHLPFIILARS